MPELIAGVDLGGTKILIGLSDTAGNIIERIKIPTRRERGHEHIIYDIVNHTTGLMAKYGLRAGEAAGIAVAAPGPVSFPEGVVKNSPNLKWYNIPLKRELSRLMGTDIIVEKDTNMAVLAEYYFGQNRGCRDLMYITVSTGIGGGLICGGHLYRGDNGGAGEVGHIAVNPEGARCGCGRYGCLEAEASGLAIARKASEIAEKGRGGNILSLCRKGNTPGAEEVAAAARAGDKESLELIDYVSACLGSGISSIVNVLNPRVLVLGGGIIFNMQDLLIDKIKNCVVNSVFPMHAEKLKIEVSKLGEDIGLLGCVAAVVHRGKY